MSDKEATIDIGTIHIRDNAAPTSLTFYAGDFNKPMLTLTADGKLILGPGLSADEATQEVARILKLKYEEMR